MRNNQNNSNNKRSRNRGKRHSNPANRVYESNGPDVKVKGTAMHIADKYMTLSRDALAVGDIIANESYAQHAEHYNRLAAAAAMYNQQQASLSQHGDNQKEDSSRMSEKRVSEDRVRDGAETAVRDGVESGEGVSDKSGVINGKRRKARRMGVSPASRSQRDDEGSSHTNGSSSAEGDSLASILPTSKTE